MMRKWLKLGEKTSNAKMGMENRKVAKNTSHEYKKDQIEINENREMENLHMKISKSIEQI